MAHPLNGKAVAITGAGSGLGRAYALAAGAAGAAVALSDIDEVAVDETAAELARVGARAVSVPGDIADPTTGRRLVSICAEEFGAIDGLVNNAGASHAGQSWNASDAEVEQIFGVNVIGVIAATHAAIPVMMQQGSGSVLNVVSGALLGMPEITLYGGSKGAILSLTYGWALEVEGSGVRVNALSPLAKTSMSDRMEDTPDHLKGPPPEHIAPAVIAMLADETAHLNGQIIRFDGQRLGFMSPPAKAPGVKRESWDPSAVSGALAGELRQHAQPFGLGKRAERR